MNRPHVVFVIPAGWTTWPLPHSPPKRKATCIYCLAGFVSLPKTYRLKFSGAVLPPAASLGSLVRRPTQHLRVLYLPAQKGQQFVQGTERPTPASLDVFHLGLPVGGRLG